MVDIQRQGKVVIERDGLTFIIMFPDGTIVGAGTKESAEKKAKRWFAARTDDDSIAMGEIEWRE
mgnify:CR=1 FL=1